MKYNNNNNLISINNMIMIILIIVYTYIHISNPMTNTNVIMPKDLRRFVVRSFQSGDLGILWLDVWDVWL